MQIELKSVARLINLRYGLWGPEAFVYFAGFVFEEWPGDDDRFLSAGEDFAAGQVEGGVLLVGAGIAHETGFGESEHDPLP